MLLRPERLNQLPGIRAGFSTRSGGVSAPPFGSLNLGLSVSDDPEAVRENRRRFFRALGFAPEQAAIAGQVHGSDVETVERGGLYPGRDALVTRVPGVLLCITAADCAAVLFADAEAGVVGACHAGWRGAVADVTTRTLDAMVALGADPARIEAYVSPCISAAAFEVGPEVAAQFDAAFVRARDGANPLVDLKAALVARLEAAGVPASQIEASPYCTATEGDRFFSHRAEQGRTGRMMGVIGRIG